MTRRQLFKNFGFGLAGMLALPLFGKPGKVSEPKLQLPGSPPQQVAAPELRTNYCIACGKTWENSVLEKFSTVCEDCQSKGFSGTPESECMKFAKLDNGMIFAWAGDEAWVFDGKTCVGWSDDGSVKQGRTFRNVTHRMRTQHVPEVS